jgi:Flp pilus assembly protein TadD
MELKPDAAEAPLNLGMVLASRGRIDEAIVNYRRALEIKPDFADAHYNLGTAFVRRGQVGEAIEQYRKALDAKPDFAAVLNNLAWILATQSDPKFRDGPQAVRLAQRSLALSSSDANAQATLAAAYAETGRFPEAVRTALKAADLAKRQNKPALVKSIQAKIRLYEAGIPFREPPPAPPRSR